jgi:ornithine cyclodeaminase
MTPVLSGEHLSPGTHVNAIGSFTPAMQEIDAATILRTGSVFTDNTRETWEVAGDLLQPLNEGLIERSKLKGDLSDILCGRLNGREDEKEITLYESVGFAALDIAVAIMAYRKFREADVGTRIEW